jgi:hypothetical protein
MSHAILQAFVIDGYLQWAGGLLACTILINPLDTTSLSNNSAQKEVCENNTTNNTRQMA